MDRGSAARLRIGLSLLCSRLDLFFFLEIPNNLSNYSHNITLFFSLYPCIMHRKTDTLQWHGRVAIDLPFTWQLRRLSAMQTVQKAACGIRTAWTLRSRLFIWLHKFSRWRLPPNSFRTCLHVYTWTIPVLFRLFPYYARWQEVPIILKIMPT